MKYRVMATFGPNAGEPFDELNMIINEIFSAAEILGTHYWKRQGRVRMSKEELQEHLAGMHKYEAVFWFMGEESDEITPRVQRAIEKIEAITRKESMMKASWFSKREKDNRKSKNRA